MYQAEMPNEDNNNASATLTCPLQPRESEVNSDAARETTMPSQDSIISLGFLKLDAPGSTIVVESDEPKLDLRLEIYKPRTQHFEIIAPPELHRAVIEETRLEFLPTPMSMAVVSEPKIEILPPIQTCAIVESPRVGVLRTYDGHEIIILSDDEDENNNKLGRDVYESADDSTLQPIEAQFCACPRRDNETQTIRRKRSATGRERFRRNSPSEGQSSEQLPQKPKPTSPVQNAFRQRQLELHRHRIAVEKKRLELLELKLERERDEMLRDRILFDKELELKSARFRKLTEDKLDE